MVCAFQPATSLCVAKTDRLVTQHGALAAIMFCELNYEGVVTINEAAGGKVLAHGALLRATG